MQPVVGVLVKEPEEVAVVEEAGHYIWVLPLYPEPVTGHTTVLLLQNLRRGCLIIISPVYRNRLRTCSKLFTNSSYCIPWTRIR